MFMNFNDRDALIELLNFAGDGISSNSEEKLNAFLRTKQRVISEPFVQTVTILDDPSCDMMSIDVKSTMGKVSGLSNVFYGNYWDFDREPKALEKLFKELKLNVKYQEYPLGDLEAEAMEENEQMGDEDDQPWNYRTEKDM